MKELYYPKCPHCGKSDGNDDITLETQIDYKNNQECRFVVTKQCDICGKEYRIEQIYKFSYQTEF